MTQKGKIPSALDDALGFNLDRVATFYRYELMQALAEYDLTPEQWQIMSVVWGNDVPLTQQDITYLLAKDKHNVSRMIRRLEDKGWLERKQSPHDARALLIRATELGESVRSDVPEKLYRHFDELDIGLNHQEQVQLVKLLKTMRDSLQAD